MAKVVLRLGKSPELALAMHTGAREAGATFPVWKSCCWIMQCEWAVGWWLETQCWGGIAGGTQGAHLAFRRLGHRKWFSRASMSTFLTWYFAEHTLLVVPKWNAQGLRILQWLGFEFGPDGAVLSEARARAWMERR
jgi:hypothetical protein